MAQGKGIPVNRSAIADYLSTAAMGEPAEYHLMNVFETIDESPNAQTAEKHYVCDKSASTFTTGYQTQIELAGDLYYDNAVSEYLRDIGEEQKLGVETDFVRVRLYQPIKDKENTYYARKFRVSPEIAKLGGAGGEIANIEGNLNVVGDVVIGEFNTAALTFVSTADAAAGSV